ncbi:MAG: hypothetical protein OXI71_12845 [Gemmatimonadota bacterium]|nr:hypothetical protein [Gemmatimonadota bacterium]MDE2677069.1 hypothetical protein [Gemmatimonadota bacterium]
MRARHTGASLASPAGSSAAPAAHARIAPGLIAGILALLAGAATPPPSAAQEPEGQIPGVELTLLYENLYIPPLAILPFRTTGDSPETGALVHGIVARDLDYSDRFRIIDSLPALWNDQQGVQYAFWDQYGVDWLVIGTVERVAGSRFLAVELHDIVTASARARGRFPLPAPDDPGFRMAVHRVSDEIVMWATGEQGIAATQIAFRMPALGDPASKEIYIVDSDGANRRRLTWDADLAVSPAWSPDGSRLAYTSYKSGVPKIYEIELATGTERMIGPGGSGQQHSPAYHPHGGEISFTLTDRGSKGVVSYNIRDGCCLRMLAGGRAPNIQPAYSRDGRTLAFVSLKLGSATPQVYTMPSEGGTQTLLSPYRYGQGGYFTDPDWSPVSNQVAFAGGIVNRRTVGRYHIFIADLDTSDNRLIQLTREGNNEDPSWAPDGRHLVFKGERRNGLGIFIVDAATGRQRVLVANVDAEDTDWSPWLGNSGGAGQSPGNLPRGGR